MGGKGSGGKVIHGHKVGGKMSPEYRVWQGMKARCYRKRHKDFPNWGGKGIRVCARWLNDFSAFLEDMGPRPDGYTIDRLDSKKDYEPLNTRWATQAQQGAENRDGLIPVIVNGIRFPTQRAACAHFGILPTTLSERLKAGISLEQAFQVGRLKARRTRESYLRKALR